MNYDTEAIAAVLVAAVEQIDDITFLRFKDARLKYELHLHAIAGTAMLAADPVSYTHLTLPTTPYV